MSTPDRVPFSRRTLLGSLAGTSLAGMLGGLSACGSPGAASGGGGGAGSSQKTLPMVGLTEAQAGRGISKLLSDYSATKANPKVKYQYFPSEQFVALLSTALRSATPPAVLWLNGQDIRKYALNGTVEPLDISYADRFLDLGPKTYTLNGKLFGVPAAGTGGFTILYNQQLLQQVGATYPETYDNLKAVGQELKKIGAAAFTHPGKTVYLWPVWFFTTYAQVTGNKSVEATQKLLQSQGSFASAEVVEALDLIFAFKRDGLFGDDVMGLDATGALANMERGKAAFWMGGDLTSILQDKPAKVTPGTQVMPLLVDTPGVVSQFPGGPGNPLTINAKATDEQKTLGLALIDYLSSDASCSYLVKDSGGGFGSNKKTGAIGDNPAVDEGEKYIDRMTVYLDWYWPPEVTTAFQQGIQAGLTNGTSAQQVAAGIQTVWEKLLKGGYTFK